MSRRMRMDPVQMQTWNALISNPSPRQIFDQRRCAGCHHILFLWWKSNELSQKMKMVFTPLQGQKARFCDPSFSIFPIFSWPDTERKWAIKPLSQCDRSQYIAIEQIGAMGLNKKVKSLKETLSWKLVCFGHLTDWIGHHVAHLQSYSKTHEKYFSNFILELPHHVPSLWAPLDIESSDKAWNTRNLLMNLNMNKKCKTYIQNIGSQA